MADIGEDDETQATFERDAAAAGVLPLLPMVLANVQHALRAARDWTSVNVHYELASRHGATGAQQMLADAREGFKLLRPELQEKLAANRFTANAPEVVESLAQVHRAHVGHRTQKPQGEGRGVA
jgi:hypothetical protein